METDERVGSNVWQKGHKEKWWQSFIPLINVKHCDQRQLKSTDLLMMHVGLVVWKNLAKKRLKVTSEKKHKNEKLHRTGFIWIMHQNDWKRCERCRSYEWTQRESSPSSAFLLSSAEHLSVTSLFLLNAHQLYCFGWVTQLSSALFSKKARKLITLRVHCSKKRQHLNGEHRGVFSTEEYFRVADDESRTRSQYCT